MLLRVPECLGVSVSGQLIEIEDHSVPVTANLSSWNANSI